MRVGIYLGWGTLSPETGGGHTFQQSLLQALPDIKTDHEFYIFYYGAQPKEHIPARHIKLVSIKVESSPNKLMRIVSKPWRWAQEKSIQRNFKTFLNKAALENAIDLMWFMTPGYEHVDIPYLYTIWDLQHRKQSFFPEVSVEQDQFTKREKLYASVIPRAAYILTGNETAKKEVVDFYRIPQERVKMLELPTPGFALKPKLTTSGESLTTTPYLFYPAQFWPHKNHIVILHALKILRETHHLNFNIIFTGSDKGNLQYIKQQVQELGIQDHVKFLGFVNRDQLISLYQNAFALVFASFFGPNNIPPLEAFALGCPALIADADGMQEQLGQAALFFNPTDEQELVTKIIALHDNHELRSTLIAAGKERAVSWTSQEYLQGVINIIDEFSAIRRCWSTPKA